MLNDQQKDFIRKNHKTKSARQIAKTLSLSRAEVSDFIQGIDSAPAVNPFRKHKKILIPLSIILLFCLHLFIRHNTFWLAHISGDQNQYAVLALKLQNFGLSGYNLRGVNAQPTDKTLDIFSATLSEDEEGSIIKGLKYSGAGYYDIPLFHKGPGFPTAIMLSHALFSRGEDYLMVQNHLGRTVRTTKPAKFFSAQFYAVIVPLFFSMATMFLTLYLGTLLFSYRVGFYAALMMAINPISILTSQKVWADDMLTVFITLSVLLFYLAQEKDRLWLSLLGGISCGVAILAKQNGGIIFAGLIAYAVLIKRQIKHIISYGIGMTLMSGYWFYKVFSVYGDPLYQPPKPNLLETDKTGWFKMLAARPKALKLFSIGIPYICPPFAFAYGSVIHFFRRLRLWNPSEKMNKEGANIVLLWFWILSFILVFIFYTGSGEHRRMLPTYPAIAILAAYILDKLRSLIKDLCGSGLIAETAMLGFLGICAFWCVPLGLEPVFDNTALILKPF